MWLNCCNIALKTSFFSRTKFDTFFLITVFFSIVSNISRTFWLNFATKSSVKMTSQLLPPNQRVDQNSIEKNSKLKYLSECSNCKIYWFLRVFVIDNQF